MTDNAVPHSQLDEAFDALRRDLIADGGPRISTMRNYRFAIVPYQPHEEFRLRSKVRALSELLKAEGWSVLSIALHKLLLDRLRADQDALQSLINRESSLYRRDPDRALQYLREQIAPHIEGPDGIARDVSRVIEDFLASQPAHADRTLVLIGRAGSLYPFFRTSALLRHIDGHTHGVPVVLLYPGVRKDRTGLSFMGVLNPDNDYRPRIYP